MPRPIEVLWLGMKKGRLVRLEVMYEEGAVPLGKLVDRLSSDYGPPRREEGDYWWSDGQTALRVFAVKGRTSAELMNVEQM
ncbi:MAG: hypothetical protein HY921_06380 [Elusimicrobia bacterium]|nr:hypothetical protein [Elusimicrobiota bacterium]